MKGIPRILSIFKEEYKEFKHIRPILTEYFGARGTVLKVNPKGCSLHFIVSFDINKFRPEGDETSVDLIDKIYSFQFDIALCKHGFLVFTIQDDQYDDIKDVEYSLVDILSGIESDIKVKDALRASDHLSEKNPNPISSDTGKIYYDQDAREIFAKHRREIEKRYTNILLYDLYTEFVKTSDEDIKYNLAKRFLGFKDAFIEYSNKLKHSPNYCNLVKRYQVDIIKPINFLERLCEHLELHFDKFKPTTTPDMEPNERKEIFQKDINVLLSKYESRNLEFKSTMRFDIRKQQPADTPRDAVLKTVAGFMNSYEGGVLIVGYDDDSNRTIGIERDFPYVGKRQNWDGWVQFFVNTCNEFIGKDFGHLYKIADPITHDDFTLAKILIDPGSRPAYVKGEDFYVRLNGQTNLLKGRQMEEYISERFPKK